MTVRRLLSTRDSMYVKLRLFLKYTRESTACFLNKRGPLRKRESLDQTWPACYKWGSVRDCNGPLVINEGPSVRATTEEDPLVINEGPSVRNGMEPSSGATEWNRPQVQRNAMER